jgi:hypothetical protein
MSVLPGWESADSTAAITHWLHVTTIVVMGLLVIAEALALIYDSRNSRSAPESGRACRGLRLSRGASCAACWLARL